MLSLFKNRKCVGSAFITKAVKSSALIALTVIAFNSTATSESELEANLQKAKAQLKLQLNHLETYSANFSQSISDINGKELQNSSGQLTLKTPNMLRWETLQPDETLLIADGSTVWNVDPFVEQVTIMEQTTITQNNPLMLLVSDDEQQWNAVDVKSVDIKTDGDETNRSRFVVKSKEENANIVQLTIEFNGNVLSSLQSTDRQQQKSLLVFSNIKQNEIVNPSLFSFEISDNYIIDDQRSQSQD
jgi:outer membrane lipoprotein carrier protein